MYSYLLRCGDAKTDASIRKISLCDECLNNLLILRSRQRLDNKIMFPSPVTGGYRDPSAITRRLHAIQCRAGVPKIRFRDLRHSFATLSLEQGVDIKTISHMLGHTDAGFTMNTYMHFCLLLIFIPYLKYFSIALRAFSFKSNSNWATEFSSTE